MKKRVVVFLILFVLSMLFCGCDTSLKSQALYTVEGVRLYLYVCGAVENEGYYAFYQGDDYNSAVAAAGINDHTAFPAFGTDLISGNTSVLAVNYILDGVEYPCADVNGVAVQYGFPIDNVDENVLRKLTEYFNEVGKITDKRQLKQVLGDDYEDNYYKFYIDEKDYEKTD